MFQIAITLELDPASVIADLESQRDKNPARAAFWRSFLLRVGMVAVLAGTLALTSIAAWTTDASAWAAIITSAALAGLYWTWRKRIIWTLCRMNHCAS